MIIDAPYLTDVSVLRSLWHEAFGDTDAFLDAFFTVAFDTRRCRCVRVEGRIVAALYWFDCSYSGHRAAYVYAVATAKAYRGQGICSALMKNTHAHLCEMGYGAAILVPGSDELFGFYERLGYSVCSRVGEICCSASAETLDIRAVSTSEYSAIRAALLPDGAVIQENESLEFLSTQVELYSAEGCLLAARCEAGILRGVELLGDVSKAPAIVNSLGCTAGKFRIPEGVIPFAMYHPLSRESVSPPSYFGLAFD